MFLVMANMPGECGKTSAVLGPTFFLKFVLGGGSSSLGNDGNLKGIGLKDPFW